MSNWAVATSIPTKPGTSLIRTPVCPTLHIRAQWHQTTVRAWGVQDVTTHAPLRSRRTKAQSVYHVRVLRDGDAPTSPLKDTRLLAVACKPLILIEAPSSAYHRGMLSLENNHSHEEETSCALHQATPILLRHRSACPHHVRLYPESGRRDR